MKLRPLLPFVITALVAVGATLSIDRVILTPDIGLRGSPGRTGPAGQTGPAGPRGSSGQDGQAEVDDEQIWEAVEADPARLTQAVDTTELEASIEEAASAAESVTSDLSSVCNALQLSSALEDEILSCP